MSASIISHPPGPDWYPVDLIVGDGDQINYAPPGRRQYIIIDVCARGGNGGAAFNAATPLGGGGGGAGAGIVGCPVILKAGTSIAVQSVTGSPHYLRIAWTDPGDRTHTIELGDGGQGAAATATSGGSGGQSGIGNAGGAGGTSSAAAGLGIAGSGQLHGGLCCSGDGGSYTALVPIAPDTPPGTWAAGVWRVLDVNDSASSPIGRYALAGSTYGGVPLSLYLPSTGGRGGASIFGPGGDWASITEAAPGAGGAGGTAAGGGGIVPPQSGGPAMLRVWLREM
jgi:hypothetical protein